MIATGYKVTLKYGNDTCLPPGLYTWDFSAFKARAEDLFLADSDYNKIRDLFKQVDHLEIEVK